MLSLIPPTYADDSAVGVEEGDVLKYERRIEGALIDTLIVNITSVANVSGFLEVKARVESTNGTIIEPEAIWLQWNATLQILDMPGQGLTSVLTVYAITPNPLNTTLLIDYLDNAGYSDLSASGNTISCVYPLNTYKFTYSDKGILTKVGITALGVKATITLVTDSDDGVSLGYTIFLIIPVAIIFVFNRKRKSIELI